MDSKKVLKKFGWNEGQGLGKNNSGVSEPIKVFMKRDNGGVGYNPGDEFTNDWWHEIFEEASRNISIEETKDDVVIRKRKRKKSEAAKKSSRLKSELEYGGFLKSTAVVIGGETKNTNKQKDADHQKEDTDKSREVLVRLSDEELLAACGGRTAHKAARHGLKLSGKIERLLRQEAEIQSAVSSSCSTNIHKKQAKHKP